MKWLLVLVGFLAAVSGGVIPPRCFSEDNLSQGFNTDLSGIVDFSFDLYREASTLTNAENFFFSPYSIWTALVLAYFGSAGNTKAELQDVLRITDKPATLALWRALEMLYENRAGNTSEYTFNIANRIYFDQTLRVRPCVSTILHNEVETVNFKDLTGSAAQINDFVSNTTKSLIPTIVSPIDMLDALMVLVNAAYFKGTWQYQFKPSNTRQSKFFITPGNSVDVPMMSLRTELRHGHSKDLSANVLELPYAGNDLSMLLLLPDVEGEEGFSAMVSALTASSLSRAITKRSMENSEVFLTLPKFKVELELKKELIEALQNLGINDLFNDTTSNLTDFVNKPGLAITKSIHKAFMEVSEEGTEAAAATGFIAYTRSSFGSVPKTFSCNRPFVFLIHDNNTKNVIFMGAYKSPVP
ncbi:ovalbumin-related protein X-like [Homarus americanus]|uniref:ovalbumin-related protein X-like n=1 Tax=Homarus americanus TaxID=6706 RepID=UPI001C482123|nr:ovalbumin-related protein X-like [Homarus americanus]